MTDSRSSSTNNLITIAALGFISYYTAVMIHEVLGHGLANFIFGARDFILTSTSMRSPDPLWNPEVSAPLVAIAGTVINLITGALFYAAFKVWLRNPASPTIGYWLWLGATINLSLCFMYPFYSGVVGVADWANAIEGWPNQGLLRAIEVIVGIIGTAITTAKLSKHLAKFSGNLFTLAWVPYFAGGAIFCVAGFRVPDPKLMIISIVPAALLGQVVVVLAPFFARNQSVKDQVAAIDMNPAIVIVALLLVAAIWFTAPGVYFSL